jgi:glycerol-3-phosphate dehydrogenase
MRPAELSHRTRRKALESLAREEFDLLVIGGGITGAGIAREAALRGLRVALVERRDFAVGTSSRSSKLIHGGLRYLQQGDVGLVIEAANERRVLRRLAPHLAQPARMVVPVQGRSGWAKIRAGLWTFDKMARVGRDERNQMLDQGETLVLEPLLRRDQVYGCGVYYECLTDDARLVLENVKSAAALGAVVANYATVTGFLSEGGRITAAVVHDTLSDAAFPVRAHAVVNAAGPWVDNVRMLQGNTEKPRLHLTKGIHLVLPRERLPVRNTIVMTASDKRSVFVVPRGDIVYLGTTDTNYTGPYDDPAVTSEDALYLLEAANRTFAVEELTLADVVGAWAGLRPLLHEEGKSPSEISRKDEIMVSDKGLISIAGGKLTTYRKMAERILMMVLTQLAERDVAVPEHPRGASDEVRLCGGDIDQPLAAWVDGLRAKWASVDGDIIERLAMTYGTNGERMIEGIAAEPQLGARCAPGSPVTRAEVEYGVREEMALTLQDFLDRRARLFLWDPGNGLDEAATAARFMARQLGWSDARIASEVAAYRDYVDTTLAFATGRPPTAEPARVAHG